MHTGPNSHNSCFGGQKKFIVECVLWELSRRDKVKFSSWFILIRELFPEVTFKIRPSCYFLAVYIHYCRILVKKNLNNNCQAPRPCLLT